MPALPDLSLCLVTDPAAPAGVETTALAAARAGAGLIQLRDKQAPDAELIALARRLRAALAPLGARLVINDRPEVAREAGADGVHVGQTDRPATEARALLGPEAIIGLSIEHPDQLAETDWAAVDYIGAGPVLATATKPGHAPPTGWDGLAAICAASPVPVLAIGGMCAATAARAKRAGAAGVAVVSAICAAEDPESAARDILMAWSRA
ncbi:MAG: thiamine phosphate synthase [Pseudomonadota bacterium]